MANLQMSAYKHIIYLPNYCKFLGTKNQKAFEDKLKISLEALKVFNINVGSMKANTSSLDKEIEELKAENASLKDKLSLFEDIAPKPQSKAGKKLKEENKRLLAELEELKNS